MNTAVDTNILFDVLGVSSPYGASSEAMLDAALRRGSLIISEPVYAELAAHFHERRALNMFLARTGVRMIPSSDEALVAAGLAWRRYSQNRPSTLRCAQCGAPNAVSCSECRAPITPRQHIVSDFLIGAHALEQAEALLTRDKGYYRTYFPELALA